ncbi:hypothetical protein BIV57_12730 [Mangrovactinospora gilvigrisea]|uniref:SHOCT domain-containing protein n=1 Tax=Mangrovactinospora gilvigrisea TaxID=1428644 RepID=A0A1J7BEJ1_9ACTN|nr:SHOCT domain-containing protein [Mangrovactinospora gilvigrisea]OIV37099.1 hypothetical protein BIV57_12730 [Mangrovactinospora gilvigrisea]
MIGRPVVRRGRPGLIGMAARTAVVAGTATAVSGRVAARQQRRAYAPQEAEPPQPVAQPAPEQAQQAQPAGDTIPEQIERLAQLQAQGLITPEEFAAGKQRLLGL